MTDHTWNTGELFSTVHERKSNFSGTRDYNRESTVALYMKIGDKLKLLLRLETGGESYFLKPTVVWTEVKGKDRNS